MQNTKIDQLYNFITGDEDARVCKDIPDAACNEQPRNFFAYLLANLLNKVADEISSAKLILPWMLGALGAPVALTGFLVPIRESGTLLPQLAVAAAVRNRPKRKGVWLLGAFLSALSLLGMAAVALSMTGAAAGWSIIALLITFSLARGLCSVSAKDVLGKTISKSRRGRLMGWSASLGGLFTLLVGGLLGSGLLTGADNWLYAALLGGAGILWFFALASFALIKEEAGATEGGGNALTVALKSLALVQEDPEFRRFIIARSLLVAVALMPPYFILLAQSSTNGAIQSLGGMIIATGLGASLSSPFWGIMGDRSSRHVMSLAAFGSALLGLLVWGLVSFEAQWSQSPWFWAVMIFLLTVLHSGIRLGRKVYLVDMATQENRAQLVAVSNTIIGLVMLSSGLIGLIGQFATTETVILALAALSLYAAWFSTRLNEVSDPA